MTEVHVLVPWPSTGTCTGSCTGTCTYDWSPCTGICSRDCNSLYRDWYLMAKHRYLYFYLCQQYTSNVSIKDMNGRRLTVVKRQQTPAVVDLQSLAARNPRSHIHDCWTACYIFFAGTLNSPADSQYMNQLQPIRHWEQQIYKYLILGCWNI